MRQTETVLRAVIFDFGGVFTLSPFPVIADAAPGVEVAILQASAPCLPVYERMGFRTVVEYEELEDAAAEPERDQAS